MSITEDGSNKKLSNNILSLAKEAKKAKDLDRSVINSTIGMLADEHDDFYTFKAVKEVMKTIDDYDMFAYSDTDGGETFHQAILSWVFGDKRCLDNKYTSVIATPGGSGAISCTFANYLEGGDRVLVPNHMWETYITFAKERGCDHLAYELFDEYGNFNIKSLKECIDTVKDQQKHILIVLNDPCENPTGFCMSDTDYDNLVSLIKEYHQYKIVLLIDMAYFDYYSDNPAIIRNRYQKLINLGGNVLCVFSFSGSKTFGLYGLRIGAAIGVCSDLAEIKHLKDAFTFSARGMWSSSSSLGIAIISHILLNEKWRKMFESELIEVSSILGKRADAFLNNAKEVGLPILPFERGFFACVPTKNPVGLMNALHQDKVYVVVTKTCIRIALCAISLEEAARLPKIIKNRMELEAFS